LLQRWSRPPLPSLENAHAELAAASASADSVSRIRRAAPILLASLPLLMLLLAALASLPRVSRLTTPEAGVMTGLLIRMLPSEDPDKDLPPSPEMKEAIEIFLAGKFGEKLNDEQIWSLGGTRVQELRNAASGILTRHPHVSPEELASAGAYAKPEIERAHEYYRAKFKPGLEKAGGVILTSLTAIALGFAIVCGLISAWAVPGGILMRLLGLAVVGVDGLEISRARSLARAAVGWLPGIAWILSLGLSPVTRMLASPVATMFGAGVAIIALAAGGAWAIARPSRGPHDHLLHTWVVPR
jgi:hypothetical protein